MEFKDTINLGESDKLRMLRGVVNELRNRITEVERQIEEEMQPKQEPLYSGFTEAQIQRVIDEGVYVSIAGRSGRFKVKKFNSNSSQPFIISNTIKRKKIKLVREVGIRQPNFSPQYASDENDRVIINTGQGYGYETHLVCDIDNWQDVKEFIVVEAGK